MGATEGDGMDNPDGGVWAPEPELNSKHCPSGADEPRTATREVLYGWR